MQECINFLPENSVQDDLEVNSVKSFERAASVFNKRSSCDEHVESTSNHLLNDRKKRFNSTSPTSENKFSSFDIINKFLHLKDYSEKSKQNAKLQEKPNTVPQKKQRKQREQTYQQDAPDTSKFSLLKLANEFMQDNRFILEESCLKLYDRKHGMYVSLNNKDTLNKLYRRQAPNFIKDKLSNHIIALLRNQKI